MRPPVLAVIALAVGLPFGLLTAAPAAADITQSSQCRDGGGHLWQGRSVWGDEYTDSAGVKRVVNNATGFTSSDPEATTVDYRIATFDGDGNVVQTLDESDRAFDFAGGTAYLTRNPRNPPSAPGKAKIEVYLGDGNDGYGNCTLTFVQPRPGSAPQPTPTASPTATPTPSPTPTSTSSPTPSPTPTSTPPPGPSGSWPSEPPAKICGNTALLSGPSSAPSGAITVPAGNNSSIDFQQAGKTFWFAPGIHTLGNGQFDQIVPADNSTYIGAPGAVLDGQKTNAYAFTQHARNVTIKYLTIRNFVAPMNEGTVNHDSGENWTMQYNTVTGNGGAGIFLGAGNVASYNCLKDNSQYGFQAYSGAGGASNIVLDHNEIVGNNTGDWENRIDGCGCTGGGKFWDVRNVKVTNNYVHDNKSVGLWADTNDNNFLIEGNWIENNDAEAIFWEISYNIAIRNNVIKNNTWVKGKSFFDRNDNFPVAAIYISESGGDSRLPHNLVGSASVDISNNLFEDNYNGVALWENADRFCGSAANTSAGYCTLVNPSVAKVSTCNAANIVREPYYSDCRWKTQNVQVHHNTFRTGQEDFSCPTSMCGRNAIFSNYGTYPSWSPYTADKISKAIVNNQNNRFSNNTYRGAWNFTVLDTGRLLSPSAWRAAPYNQDPGSTFTG